MALIASARVVIIKKNSNNKINSNNVNKEDGINVEIK